MNSKSKPKVSVIIPTYNRAHLIDRAIRSVLNQTYQDFELIIVDDGSMDDTEGTIKSFKDERIRYIRHKKNKGEAAARNTGIKIAKGQYIAFQDSDDESFPQRLEKQIKVLQSESSKVGIVYTSMYRFDKKGEKHHFVTPTIMPEDGLVYREALDDQLLNIGIGTAVVRRSCFETVGLFDERLPYFVDFDFFIRLSKYFYFYHIDEPLINYYETEGSLGSNLSAFVTSRKIILENYFEDIKKDKRVLANHYLGIGIGLCANGEIEEGESYFAKAFKTYPLIKKDRRSLSKHYFGIGINLCSREDFEQGRNYLIKAVKANPLNVKFLLIAFLSFFGQDAYNKVAESYRKVRNVVGCMVEK
jgi:glycosyltransferase involved in cell wall biosynthesis